MKNNIKVNFGGIIPISTVDWHGKSSCVIFFNKCPFACQFCQNYKLLDKMNYVDIDIIKKKICDSKDFISAVVFSGGEPTMQYLALKELAKFSKKQGLLVGVQTNGYYTNVLQKLVDDELVDRIFLDIKADPLNPEKYSMITGGITDACRNVIKTLHIQNVIIEVRTTVFRPLIDDILEIAKYLKEHNFTNTYVIQQCIPKNARQGEIRKEKRISLKELNDISNNVSSLTGITIKVVEGKDFNIFHRN